MGWQFEVNNRLSVVLCISQRRVSGWGGSESKGVEPLIGMNCPWRAVGLFSKVVHGIGRRRLPRIDLPLPGTRAQYSLSHLFMTMRSLNIIPWIYECCQSKRGYSRLT